MSPGFPAVFAVQCAVDSALSAWDGEELAEAIASWGFKPSHAARLLRAYYAADGVLPGALPGVPSALIERWHAAPDLVPRVVDRRRSGDGTTKLLLGLRDGRTVEAVLMPDHRPDRAGGCVSTQVGCAMGCDFCATTRPGFERHLTSGEIVEQFLALRREAAAVGRRLQTVVFMGMGEPLLNFEAVAAAVRRMADNRLGALGWRQITVSTVGIVPGIDALTELGWKIQLAVSLHAPDDATRATLIPVGRRYAIDEILAAADRFQARRGMPVTLQYCLLAGVNDAPEQADRLAALLVGRRMHVNLLRYNPTGPGPSGRAYRPVTHAVEAAFVGVLASRGVVVHVRRSRGPDIDAACGQLRARSG